MRGSGEVEQAMTTQQIVEMIRESELERVRFRLDHTPNNLRLNHKKRGAVKGNKGNARSKGWDA